MATVGDLINDARVALLDETEDYRYSNPLLLRFANEAMEQCIAKRPDLIFGNYATEWVALTAEDNFPFLSKYRPAAVDYIVFRANAVDQEDTALARAAAFKQSFEGLL